MSKKAKSNFAVVAEKALQEAVKKALETHAKMGVPAVFMKDGKLCYRLPNGKIVYTLKKGNRS
jgi:hypothetical protein